MLGDSGVESLEAVFKVVGEFFELAGGEADFFSGDEDGFSGGLAIALQKRLAIAKYRVLYEWPK